MREMKLNEPVETFTIVVEEQERGGIIALDWDDRRYWVPFEVAGGM